jgi:3-oxoacyl-[acyl-carrier-protein] synthase-1
MSPQAGPPSGRPIDGLTIVGYGGCCALGADLPAIEAGLRAGRVALCPAPFTLPWDAVVGMVPDPLPGLPARLAQHDSRAARLALLGLDPLLPTLEPWRARVGADRLGVVVGTSTGGIDATESAIAALVAARGLPPGYSFADQHELGAVPRFVAELLGWAGPAYAVSTACSSSTRAVASAARLIGGGICDAVLVGGVDCLCQLTVFGFHSLGILSPAGARPFCRDRAGTHIGEGAGWLLLARDAAGPLRLVGWGESSDAHSMTAPHPEGLGLRRAVDAALARAGCAGDALDYVNAHGTGTLQNDAAELRALGEVLGPRVPVSSTKGMTGHALGAAGAIELVIAALALERGFLPPNASSSQAGFEDWPLGLVATARTQRLQRVMSVSAGFGGNNAAVILEAA